MLGFGEERLSIYLNDHLAGSTAGVNLARRLAKNNRSTAAGPELAAIAEEIEQDRGTLLEVMERLSVSQDPVKTAASWAAEKTSRLKLNGELIGYSALSRLEELEALSLGVEGKLSLWKALAATRGSDPRLRTIDFETLMERARSQRQRLEGYRTSAAAEALA